MPRIPIQGAIPQDFSWFCEPSNYRVEQDKIIICPDSGSDFWQRTHYGFRNNNGHCLWTKRSGDFILQTHVKYEPKHRFDQAGLIVYFTEDFWVKCSVEHEPMLRSIWDLLLQILGTLTGLLNPFQSKSLIWNL